MTGVSKQKQIQHLYLRAGFGSGYQTYNSSLTLEKHVDLIFQNAASIYPLSLVDKSTLPSEDYKDLSAERKSEIAAESLKYDKELNVMWLSQLTETDAVFREKMTLFWHGHFACRSLNPVFTQDLNNIQRQYALGKFKDLLLQVSKSAAMLDFLNNQQNRKKHPNENFARELMELFTLGRGNYTEQDIKESARAFTGWGFDKKGDFEFHPERHDSGEKTFFGKTGNFNGEDILDILLQQKTCAHFICSKAYRFFVNDEPDEGCVNTLTDSFYESGYDIAALMKTILTSEWFYDKKNIGVKIKSPIELLVGLNRSFGVKYEDPNVLIYIQKLLGQQLFAPPNVSGWAGGKNWIDSSSLMLRLKLPSIVLNNGIIALAEKEEPEEYKMLKSQEELKVQSKVQRKVKAIASWEKFEADVPKDMTKAQLADFLLQREPPKEILDLISEPGNGTIKSAALELLSLPEYQLC